MPTFEIKGPDGSVYQIDGPDELGALNALKKMLSATSTVDPATFPTKAAGMSHEQMVEAYRATKPGDPWGDYLAEQIQKPKAGETAAQAKVRAGGTGSVDRVTMSPTGKAAATFLQGVPFAGEYMDEGLGYVAGKMGLQSQQDATNAIRAGQADMDQNNPKTATALRIGGGVAGSAVGAGIMPWYNPATLGGRVAYGAGVGGTLGTAEGAVSGYGSGTDDASRSENAKSRALLGGLLGTAVGGAAPLLAEGVSQGGRWLLDQFNVAREARQAGLSRPSYEHLVRVMDADGSLNGAGAQRIAAAGPEAMLADAGPSAENVLDTAIQRSGPAGVLAGNRIEGRAGRTGLIANDALDNTLGVPRGIQTMETGIRQGSSAARGSTYQAAYSQPINYAAPEGQRLEQWFRQVPGDILQKANRLMQVRREPASAQIILRQQPDGSFAAERLPDIRQWDYITRAMNDIAQTNDGAGALGGQTDIGAGFQSFSRDIRQTLRGMVPEYATALDTAADAIDARNALRFGEGLLSPTVTRDEVANTLAGYSAAERRHAAEGVRSFIDEKIANVTRAISDNNMGAREAAKAVKDLSSRAAREKITALVGQQQADAMFEQLDQAARGLELRAAVADGSGTFARTSTNAMIEDATNGGLMGKVRSGEPVNATKELWRSLLGGTSADNIARADRVFAELSDALTSTAQNGGRSPQQILQNLQRIATANPRNAAVARTIGSLIGYPIFGPLAYQSGTQGLLGRER